MIARTNANAAAAQNPFVLKLVMILSTNNTSNTLMIKPTNHRVSQLSGIVTNFNNAPSVAFTNHSTSATRRAHMNQSTCTHGTIYAVITTATADNKS